MPKNIIGNLLLEEIDNYTILKKIIIDIKETNNKKLKLESIKNNYIKKRIDYLILNTLSSTAFISLISVLLKYSPNILFYLLISYIISFYFFINKYINIKYKNNYKINDLNNKINELTIIYKYKLLEKEKAINNIKINNNKIKALNNIKNIQKKLQM